MMPFCGFQEFHEVINKTKLDMCLSERVDAAGASGTWQKWAGAVRKPTLSGQMTPENSPSQAGRAASC